jgi:peptide methionine sulfoxide reductase MsrB
MDIEKNNKRVETNLFGCNSHLDQVYNEEQYETTLVYHIGLFGSK